jgi:hypothetical protein
MTSPHVHSKVDSNTFTMSNPMPESTLTLCQSRLYPPVRGGGGVTKTGLIILMIVTHKKDRINGF